MILINNKKNNEMKTKINRKLILQIKLRTTLKQTNS